MPVREVSLYFDGIILLLEQKKLNFFQSGVKIHVSHCIFINELQSMKNIITFTNWKNNNVE